MPDRIRSLLWSIALPLLHLWRGTCPCGRYADFRCRSCHKRRCEMHRDSEGGPCTYCVLAPISNQLCIIDATGDAGCAVVTFGPIYYDDTETRCGKRLSVRHRVGYGIVGCIDCRRSIWLDELPEALPELREKLHKALPWWRRISERGQ